MYKQVEKSKENKSRTVANSVAQKKNNGRQGFDFVDNRPKNTVAQLMLPAGKKGGAYFSRSGYTKEQVAKAQESVGMTSGHGS